MLAQHSLLKRASRSQVETGFCFGLESETKYCVFACFCYMERSGMLSTALGVSLGLQGWLLEAF